MADYFSDGGGEWTGESGPKHGDKYYDPDTMNVKMYDETIGMWFTMTMDERLDLSPPPIAVSGVISVPTYSKPASGNTPTKLPPAPPRPKPITDFDFDEEDFEL